MPTLVNITVGTVLFYKEHYNLEHYTFVYLIFIHRIRDMYNISSIKESKSFILFFQLPKGF